MCYHSESINGWSACFQGLCGRLVSTHISTSYIQFGPLNLAISLVTKIPTRPGYIKRHHRWRLVDWIPDDVRKPVETTSAEEMMDCDNGWREDDDQERSGFMQRDPWLGPRMTVEEGSDYNDELVDHHDKLTSSSASERSLEGDDSDAVSGPLDVAGSLRKNATEDTIDAWNVLWDVSDLLGRRSQDCYDWPPYYHREPVKAALPATVFTSIAGPSSLREAGNCQPVLMDAEKLSNSRREPTLEDLEAARAGLKRRVCEQESVLETLKGELTTLDIQIEEAKKSKGNGKRQMS